MDDPEISSPAPHRGVLGDSQLQSQTLEDLTSAVHYHRWLRDLARPHLGSNPMEIGSGLGDYASSYVEEGVPHFTVTEADQGRLAQLQRRFADESRVDVKVLDLTDAAPRGEHSCVVAFNVLEHIPDHVQALGAAARLVEPGGAVVMFVPAFPFAMSRFDRRVGHVRRYTRRSLSAAYRAADLRLEVLHYVNAPGLPAWFVGMKLLRGTPHDGLLLRIWDRVVVRAARRLESVVHPPFGQSVFAVGRSPSSDRIAAEQPVDDAEDR